MARLRRGEPAAVAALWADWKDAVWSVCRVMAADLKEARLLLASVYADLGQAARGWPAGTRVCCGMAAHVYRTLSRLLELHALDGIEIVPPRQVGPPPPDRVASILATVPPAARLVYVTDLFCRCPLDRLAELVGVDEARMRAARAFVAWRLVDRSGP